MVIFSRPVEENLRRFAEMLKGRRGVAKVFRDVQQALPWFASASFDDPFTFGDFRFTEWFTVLCCFFAPLLIAPLPFFCNFSAVFVPSPTRPSICPLGFRSDLSDLSDLSVSPPGSEEGLKMCVRGKMAPWLWQNLTFFQHKVRMWYGVMVLWWTCGMIWCNNLCYDMVCVCECV